MSPLPLPIRLAAGLAAVAVERARKLPQDVTEWPMSAVSQALQLSMRVQQRITELAIKGDEALAGLREPEEDPPWAVFDEDLPPPAYLRPPRSAYDLAEDQDEDDDWLSDADDLTATTPAAPSTAAAAPVTAPVTAPVAAPAAVPVVPPADTGEGPGALPAYPGLSLPSVRARLRTLGADQLEELLAYERGHADRPDFVRMLTNRIATVRGR
jgi:hypothetical protein